MGLASDRGAERVALGTGDKALQALVDAEEEEDDEVGQAGGVEAQEPMSGLVNDRQAAAKTRQVQSRTLLFGLTLLRTY